MKQLIVCSDGTWQKITSPYPTNVVKITQAIAYNSNNLIFYGEGIGTGNLIDRIAGGLFELGIDKNIQDAYRFLCLNYAPGDQIYLFGFSRGAYTVRSLVGLIRSVEMLVDPKIQTNDDLKLPFFKGIRSLPSAAILHESVYHRWHLCRWYRPRNLVEYHEKILNNYSIDLTIETT
jgi:hypothetical protein